MLKLKKYRMVFICMLFSFAVTACAEKEEDFPYVTGSVVSDLADGAEHMTSLSDTAQPQDTVPLQNKDSSQETDGQTAPASAAGETQAEGFGEMSAEDKAEEILSEMSLYEKICQMLVISPESLTRQTPVTAAGEATKQALADMPVGGVLYSRQNYTSQEQVREMTERIQSYSRIPLILTCDEEGGRVNRLMDTVHTTHVGPMLDYKDQGTETAYKNAHVIASDMHSLGLNFDMAPVADVWSNPENTVIGNRAYSDDFQQAASLVAAAVEGFHDGGVGTALKHFPGHGDTSADSHKGAVYVSKTLDELREEELVPFKAGIEAGSDMVMAGHLIVSDIDDEPAPFSHKFMTELLRSELGFDGVIITDSLQMKAMTDYYGSGEIARKAVLAGVDMLLCPADPKEAVNALQNAVEKGEISEQRIEESVRRILIVKIRRGIIE